MHWRSWRVFDNVWIARKTRPCMRPWMRTSGALRQRLLLVPLCVAVKFAKCCRIRIGAAVSSIWKIKRSQVPVFIGKYWPRYFEEYNACKGRYSAPSLAVPGVFIVKRNRQTIKERHTCNLDAAWYVDIYRWLPLYRQLWSFFRFLWELSIS